MNNPLSIGILGAGSMGGAHARRLAQLPDVRITAICSQPRETAERLAAEATAGAARVYDDVRVMLRKEKLDALYVCLPPYAHSGQVEAAARKGIHLFVEKPLALTTSRARRMLRAAQQSGVITHVGYHMRYGGAVRRLKQLLESGAAGRPTLFDARFDCNSLHSAWWRDKTMCGGQVFEQVIHLYDMALHLLGAPSRVAGFTANLCHAHVPDYTVEDTSASVIRFRSGAMASITGSNCAVPMVWNGPFTLVCEKLTAYVTSPNEAEFIYTAETPVRRETVRCADDPYLEESRAFIAALRDEPAALAPFSDGVTGLTVVAAVLTSSAADGKPIVLS
jgi:predicted dehydrogenase